MANSLPAGVRFTETLATNLLAAVTVGDFEAWIAYNCPDENLMRPDQVTPVGTVITVISSDPISMDKVLVIYSMYGFGHNPTLPWLKCINILKKYAKSQGCRSVMAYTDKANVLKIAEYVKFSWQTMVLEMDLSVEDQKQCL